MISISTDLILKIFYYTATLGLIVKVFLLWINIRHIQKHSNKVPTQFSDMISQDDHFKAAQYSTSRLKFRILTTIFHFILLMIWLPLGGIAFIDNFSRSLGYSPIATGLIFFAAYAIISLIINIPESLYSTFVIEQKFGFNKTTKKLFVTDLIKQLLLSFILMIPILYCVLTFMDAFKTTWWLYTWAFIIAFQFLLIWAYPKFISPLFNKFTPLEDKDLTEDIDKLGKKINLNFKDYFVMNASLRSSHGNAYFTGFGKNRRIVFFDTLIETLTKSEVLAVLAHELGHLKKKHILKSLIMSTLFLGAGLYLLFLTYNQESFYKAFNLENSDYIALILFSFLVPQVTYFFTPIGSWFSRKNEYEADAFSVEHTDGKSLITALIRMYKDNSSSLTPSPLFSKFYNSHPPAIERVKYIESLIK